MLAAAQPYAWQQAQHRWLILQSALALAVLAAAGLFLRYGDSLVSGFAVLAALLLGAALILPAILERVLSFGQRQADGALAGWFWADSRQQLSGLSLALMALLLALAVNVGVGTMVETFSRTFVTWLDGRLGGGRLCQRLRRRAGRRDQDMAARRVPKSRRSCPAAGPRCRSAGAPIEILGMADHATYRDHWPLLEADAHAWRRLLPGDAALVSEQLARRLKLGIGDSIEIPTQGGNWKLEIVGIYADYGNPKGQVAVNIAAFTRRFPDAPLTRMGLRVWPAAIPALISDLQQKFGLDGRNLMDQVTLKAESTRIFNKTFAVTAALNAFTLGVAGIALLTSLLTLSNSRLPQLAPLWAIGITRRRLAAIELLKTLSVALITTLLALPLGLLVAWCLIAVVNVKAFGWRLPFDVFPLQLLQLLAVAMAASLLAALLPVVKLARMQPARLIKIFADER